MCHPLPLSQIWVAMFDNITSVNRATFIMSAVAMVFLVIFKILNKLLKSPRVKIPVKVYKRDQGKWTTKYIPWPIPIPSQLIVVCVCSPSPSLPPSLPPSPFLPHAYIRMSPQIVSTFQLYNLLYAFVHCTYACITPQFHMTVPSVSAGCGGYSDSLLR